MNPTFSVIVPIYNEAARVPVLASSYCQALDTLGESWELIFVVNGCRDNSHAVALQEAARDGRIRVLELVQGGWGRAVKLGLEHARGTYMCYTNSARTEIPDLLLALRYALVNQDVVVKASRIVRDSWLRKIGSSLYNFEYRLLFRVPVWDVNGTPKVLPRRVLEQLPPVASLADGDIIDAQLVARCFRAQVRILEMPVLCTRRYGGKSTTNWRSAWKMYTGLVRLLGSGL